MSAWGKQLTAAVVLGSLALPTACATTNRPLKIMETGRALFRTAFDPDRNFAGDLDLWEERLVLTAAASSREDYYPEYSLAIAYRHGKSGFVYQARILRVGTPTGETQSSLSGKLIERVMRAKSTRETSLLLAGAELQWLEADVGDCKGGIDAMDSIRVTDWQPDVHFGLQEQEEREIIIHPAMIKVRMSGSYITSRYEGWRYAEGVPEAVHNLLKTLEPCWKPSPSLPPWERR